MYQVVRRIARHKTQALTTIKDLKLAASGFQHVRAESALTVSQEQRVIFSGIQPTGIPHLGNYLGALKSWVTLQETSAPTTALFFSVVNLHAFTVKRPAPLRRQWQRELFATLLAVGLDPRRSVVFFQSHVPQHLQLMWLLGCNASRGPMERLTQWKDKKAQNGEDEADWGLYSYPILQAADILLYQTTHVPVGQDQSQHLEYARHLARSFNHQYEKNLFTIPETILSPAKRVMSLQNPALKMSKSHADPKSRIQITDSAHEIARKIKAAVTDSTQGVSYDPATRPGVSNLLEIIHHMEGGTMSCEEIARDLQGLSMKALKDRATESIVRNLGELSHRYEEILNRDRGRYVDDVAEVGKKRAVEIAEQTMNDVKATTGFEL